MLETVDLGQKIPGDEYKLRIAPLISQIGALQRQARDAGVPVVIVVDGWYASGKGLLLNFLNQSLDPRGARLYSAEDIAFSKKQRPFLWPFWTNTPAKGQIVVYDASWYQHLIARAAKNRRSDGDIAVIYRDILRFEQALADDGCVMIKLFLHIDRKEQKNRLKTIEHEDYQAWRISKKAWKQNRRYEEYRTLYEQMLAESNLATAPWTVIPANDKHQTRLLVAETLVKALAARLQNFPPAGAAEGETPVPTAPDCGPRPLATPALVDQADTVYHKLLEDHQQQLRVLQFEAHRRGVATVIVFEGWDAAGKGGAIHRLCHGLDPRGYHVVPVAAPTEGELQHHYLWRFWREFPADGDLVVFDRSWYGRVLVERVEHLATQRQWKRAYSEINAMEEHLAAHGVLLLKFWLDITPEVQLERFQERETDPEKIWKITAEDWRNRAKRNEYEPAVADMLKQTHFPHAPWHVIDATRKQNTRLTVLQTVIQALQTRCDNP